VRRVVGSPSRFERTYREVGPISAGHFDDTQTAGRAGKLDPKTSNARPMFTSSPDPDSNRTSRFNGDENRARQADVTGRVASLPDRGSEEAPAANPLGIVPETVGHAAYRPFGS
jgi:hypothetical protein